jgi:O-antigen/teichoic acid export membrane protein
LLKSTLLKKLFRYLVGQSGIFAINAVVGLIVIRLLPLTEYSTVVIVLFLQVATTVLADLGTSHVVLSQFSNNVLTPKNRESLIKAAISQTGIFSAFAIPSVFLLGWVLLRESPVESISLASIVLLAVVTGLIQSSLNIRRAELNADHNDRLLFRLGFFEGVVRIMLLPLCILFPFAIVVVGINLVAVGLTLLSFRRISNVKLYGSLESNDELRSELRAGTIPLVPGAVYALFQGQIGVLILGFCGQTQLVAEAGALGRLAQIINFLLVLNPFWVQPYFSRLRTNYALLTAIVKLMGVLTLLTCIIWASVIWVPGWWLMILGDQYTHTSSALRIAMAGVLIHAIFAVSYTVAIAMKLQSGQHWSVSLSVLFQLFFIMAYDVDSVEDALMLQLLPALGSLIVQWALIGRHFIASGFNAKRY